MDCKLHIGTPKTATTSIQEFICLNRTELLQQGIICTQAAQFKANTEIPNTTAAGFQGDLNLTLAAFDIYKKNGLCNQNNIHSQTDLERFQSQLIADLKAEIGKISTDFPGCSKIVFSSEYIHLLLTEEKQLTRFKSVLHGLGINKIDIIVYLRNPADLASSFYSTSIKSGGIGTEPPNPDNQQYRHLCDHRQTLERYINVFGDEAVHPRLFDRNSDRSSSIVDDFIQSIGASKHGNYISPDNRNLSLSTEGVEILRRLNHYFPVWIGKLSNPLRVGLVDYFEEFYSKGSYRMPSITRKKYDEYYRDSNEWVRGKYFSDRKFLFAEKHNQSNKMHSINDAQTNSLTRDLATRWLENFSNRAVNDSETTIARFSRNLAVCTFYYYSGEYQNSIDDLTKLQKQITAFHPDTDAEATRLTELNRNTLTYLANGFMKLARYESADSTLLDAQNTFPNDNTFFELYAQNSQLQKKWLEAIHRWQYVESAFTDYTQSLHFHLGVCLMHANIYRLAIEKFNTFLDIHPEHPQSLTFKQQCIDAENTN